MKNIVLIMMIGTLTTLTSTASVLNCTGNINVPGLPHVTESISFDLTADQLAYGSDSPYQCTDVTAASQEELKAPYSTIYLCKKPNGIWTTIMMTQDRKQAQDYTGVKFTCN